MALTAHEDIIDILLKYGLMVGAVFQLICIGAVIAWPDSTTHDPLNDSDSSDDDLSEDLQGSPSSNPNNRHQHKKRNDRSKKRR